MKNNVNARDFAAGPQKRLWKCEFMYRAEVLPEGSEVDWPAPHCENAKDIAEFLREIGFQIAEIMDAVDDGYRFRWVRTKSGIAVCANEKGSNGFVAEPHSFRRTAPMSKRRTRCGF